MKIDIIFTTWPRNLQRMSYLIVCYESLKRHLVPGDAEINYIFCLEARGLTEKIILYQMIESFCINRDIEFHYKTGDPSLSSMLNFANSQGTGEYILFMQDDWFLTQNLHLIPIINHLNSHDNDYVVRLSWHKSFEKSSRSDTSHLLYINPNVSYYYSDNPHIKKRNYHKITGPFPDSIENGVDQGRCENHMARKARRLAHKCKILTVDRVYFEHIGEYSTTLTEKTFKHR